MKNLNLKLKHIYLPFLLIAICCIAGYSFLNWLFVIKTEWIDLNETWATFGIPFALPWIPLLIWLWPRINMLIYSSRSGDPHGLRIAMAGFAIAIPTLISQQYLNTATGKLSKLNNVEEIDIQPLSKYYTFRNFYVDKQHASVYRTAEVTGKNSEYLDYEIILACPVYSKPIANDEIVDADNYYTIDGKKILTLVNGRFVKVPELYRVNSEDIRGSERVDSATAHSVFGSLGADGVMLMNTAKSLEQLGFSSKQIKNINPKAWLAVQYKLSISNRLSRSEKDEEWKSFWDRSYKDFAVMNLSNYEYLDRLRNTDLRKNAEKAIRMARVSPASKAPIIFDAKHTPFEQRNGNSFAWIFGSFGIGAVGWFLLLIPGSITPNAVNRFKTKAGTKEQWRLWAEPFLPRTGYFVTPILININVLVFILMVIAGLGFMSFGAEDLLAWGANYRPYTEDGQGWRLLTSIFLHGGAIHLVMNMVSLMFIGIMLEPVIGYKKYIIAYLVTGIVASITSMYWHTVVGVGASGAIFGLYGVFGALITTPVINKKDKRGLGITIAIFVGYNLIYGLTGGIDNAAHIGGLASGIIIGYIYYLLMKPDVPEKMKFI